MRGGGAERVLLNLFNLMDLDKYDVELIVIEDKGILWNDIPIKVKKKLLFPNKYISKLATLLYRKFGYNSIFNFFGKKIKGKYDVGISYLDSIHTEFLFLNRAEIEKKAVVIHSSYKSYPQKMKMLESNSYKNKVLERYNKVDTIITVSHESLSEFIDIFGKFPEMSVFYNPLNKVDIFTKSKLSRPEEIVEGTFNFIAIGSLISVKGFDLLIDACKYLKDAGCNFSLNILGEGELMQELQMLIDKYSLRKHVFLRGFKENPYPWIANSQALVMTSIAEGLPTVLCESLILGIPTITPNVPGCREIVQFGEYGLVYERNPEELYLQMKNLITDNGLVEKYSKKSLQRSKIFDDENVLNNYYDLFNGKELQ